MKAVAVRRDAELRRAEDARRAANTFSAAFNAFAEEHLSALRTGAVVRGVIDKHVMPVLGARPLSEITRVEANNLLRPLAKKMPTGANRVRSYLRTFGKWAEDDSRIDESPFANLKHGIKEKARDRVLTELEMRAIWGACANMGAFGRAFRFMLATGQRRSEVGNMMWSEIDEAKKLWTLPRERTKSDRKHEVPLSPLAQGILADSPRIGAHVFGTRATRHASKGERRTETAPISGWSKAKKRLDELALTAVKEEADRDAKLPEWHLHDLRRTAATRMAKLRIGRVVIGKVLNHAEREVTAVYDRHDYDMEKRQALDLWGATLAAIVDGGHVVKFPARGA